MQFRLDEAPPPIASKARPTLASWIKAHDARVAACNHDHADEVTYDNGRRRWCQDCGSYVLVEVIAQKQAARR